MVNKFIILHEYVKGQEDTQCIVFVLGTFNLHVRVEYLFFIGSQLVALSPTGKIGVWHAMTHHWQIQDVVPIASFDTAGSFLLLGCNNGSIYYIGEFEIVDFSSVVFTIVHYQ